MTVKGRQAKLEDPHDTTHDFDFAIFYLTWLHDLTRRFTKLHRLPS